MAKSSPEKPSQPAATTSVSSEKPDVSGVNEERVAVREKSPWAHVDQLAELAGIVQQQDATIKFLTEGYNNLLGVGKAHGEWLQKLETMVTAIGVAKAYANPEFRLWTDNPLNLFRAMRLHFAGGQITKADFEQILDFATDGAIYWSRIVPRSHIKHGAEDALASGQRIVGIMQLLTGKGRYWRCDPKQADYVLYAGIGVDAHDGNLWVHDPRKHPETPSEFVGISLGFTVTNPEEKKDAEVKAEQAKT